MCRIVMTVTPRNSSLKSSKNKVSNKILLVSLAKKIQKKYNIVSPPYKFYSKTREQII